MSSTQDVRFSDAKVQQGARPREQALERVATDPAESPAEVRGRQPRAGSRVEDRWILSRLERTIASVTEKLEAYDFAHAAQEAYSFFWSELCDWYLEIVKPRLYEGEEEVSANLLWALERVLALLHPMMPFVTEEIWSYHPARRGHLAVHPFPEADESLIDAEAEAEVERGIELTRRLRAWRDLVEAPAASVLPARAEGVEPQEFVGRLARFEFGEDGGEPVAAVGPVRVLASAEIDAGAVARAGRGTARGAARRGRPGRGQTRQRALRRQGSARGRRGGA